MIFQNISIKTNVFSLEMSSYNLDSEWPAIKWMTAARLTHILNLPLFPSSAPRHHSSSFFTHRSVFALQMLWTNLWFQQIFLSVTTTTSIFEECNENDLAHNLWDVKLLWVIWITNNPWYFSGLETDLITKERQWVGNEPKWISLFSQSKT